MLVAHRESRLRGVGVLEELATELGIRYLAGDAVGVQIGEERVRWAGAEQVPDQ